LAILQHAEEVTGNVAKTCGCYGISRQLFYTWKRRYDAEGVDGLRDRSSRPKHARMKTVSTSRARSSPAPELPLRADEDR
jgi:transposase-like protein